LEHGLPSWVHPPPPPPLTAWQRPAPPSFAEQALPQQSLFRRQISPLAWQLYARTQTPPWQLVEQQFAPEVHAWPITPHVWPAIVAHVPLVQVAVQQSALLLQVAPTSRHCWEEHEPFRQWFEQQSVFAAQVVEGPLQKVGVEQLPLLHTPEQHTPPLLGLQLLPEVRQMLPGPPS
jgi:hypothetical protein